MTDQLVKRLIKIRINDPDNPGNIIPLIPITPHRKIKKRLLFSLAGVIKLKDRAIILPKRRLMILVLSHF